ncbi:BatD family protein [Stieleria sp. JC731]|uniref:BatD family protein n=1 Tax=Pirellulaceae TaxID=2691357 RepID=UPI001E620883|nr:BatD family protein [Stieleria sp. JC731]MCC9600462.1 BatD family protein [Stieleria sp. JC731]
MNRRIFSMLMLVFLGTGLPVHAQDNEDISVEITKQRPPHYAGVSATVQLTVRGLELRPNPTCEISQEDANLTASVSEVGAQVMQQIEQTSQGLRRVQMTSHQIRLNVSARKPGTYQVGPFVIRQDGIEKNVPAFEMTFDAVPETDQMRVELVMPKVAYPDQRVKVKIRWAMTDQLRDLRSFQIESPVFDQFRFVQDPSPSRDSNQLLIVTSQGVIGIEAIATEETIDGKEFTVLTAERVMIPDRVGDYELDPITATAKLVTRRQRIDLGGRFSLQGAFGANPVDVRLLRAEGEPLQFSVKPFPTENRPDSFAGAVGSGFSIDVSADRTVVNEGDPIRLKIDVRGDGNLENASLPPLAADNGLKPSQFRVSDGEVAGVYQPDSATKSFEVSVRVEDESVVEIPGLAYSWFDPERETYQTARSSPIAMRVNPAEMVTADAVVSANPGSSAAQRKTRQPAEAVSTSETAASYLLTGADLSITTDTAALLASSDGFFTNRVFQMTAYSAAILCLLWTAFDSRRRKADPELRQASSTVASLMQQVRSSKNMPSKQAANQIATALRTAQRELRGIDRDATDAIIARCEAIQFRPQTSSDDTIDSVLIEDALHQLPG